MNMEDLHPKVLANVGYAIVAFAGGFARYLESYLKTGKFNVGLALANVFISGFSGIMFANAAALLDLDSQWMFVLAGVGGFVGGKAVEWMYERLKK